MSEKKKTRGLGRGLSALMSDVALDQVEQQNVPRSSDQNLPIELIKPNPDQPRRVFLEDDLTQLTDSIKEKGVIQPLIVRPQPNGTYQIVAGERRWRAAQMAQLHEVPVVVREFSDIETLEIAIIENIQRADLNPLEEAQGYAQLIEKFGHTQDQMAQALGKSRSHIANFLRLLKLPEPIRDMLMVGDLTQGHARALITLDDPLPLAKRIVAQGLSVREAERLAKSLTNPRPDPVKRSVPVRDADTVALENDLSANLNMKVSINHVDGAGKLTINYGDLDELDTICQLLSVSQRGASI
ncbi:ParB/RepB/Spo0J family partition protein [Actibacterium sp. 188UL27-1]|uniref:ParB/RepB/Spo0J family partition protein n=1 Tax=Actibacterium sp. 188UL27-1 TaxID=2786961 RepID=UPI001957DE87|nr:ParB/RepB/Spo0J family partition protein [Actibacterium sp. 188UL27-1]MBM7067274.1 ParB/RepB/Spo0J family partition protein [Actibacterium sp. 188UL27-1]